MASVRGDRYVERLGYFVHHDWEAIDAAERGGPDVDLDDYILALEDLTSGAVRVPTPDEVAAVKAVTLARRRTAEAAA